ncbi:MAG: SUF system Fe-S cluster assembly protein [Bacteroidetes bacterium]|jgi:FeS assembly SUF system protein|nr:SUF system Fe-S cluster assembly protein [Bacteroidota bacterium]
MGAEITNLSDDIALEERIIENIKEIYDPEIPVNVYDLGLIYRVDIAEDKTVHVTMTLTAPNCPAAGILPGQVEQAVGNTDGVADVDLELTFDPPFTPEMMSDEARLELGFM